MEKAKEDVGHSPPQKMKHLANATSLILSIPNCTGVALATFQIPAAAGGYSNMLKLVDRCDNLLFLGVENSANMWRKRKEADFFFSAKALPLKFLPVTRGFKGF